MLNYVMGKWMSKQRRNSFKTSTLGSRHHSASNADEISEVPKVPPKTTMSFPYIAESCENENITSIAVGQQKYLLSGDNQGNLVLQDIEKNTLIRRWNGHSKEVTKVKIHGDNIFTASRDKTLKVWARECQEQRGQMMGHTLSVTAMDADDHFTQICSGSRDNSMIMWDVENLSKIYEKKLSRNLVTDICWSKVLNLIAQTAEDKMLKLWDPRNMQIIHTFPPQNQIQTSCDINQRFCVTGNKGFDNKGCELCLWDLRERKLIKSFKCDIFRIGMNPNSIFIRPGRFFPIIYRSHTETVSCCKFLHNNDGFISCSHDGTLKMWRPPDNQELTNAQLFSTVHLRSGTLTCVGVANDRNILCSSFSNGIVPVRLTIDGLSL